MRYLLDTNVCIRVLNGTSPELVERLSAHHPSEIGISTIVRAELNFGARKSQRMAENLTVLGAFLAPFAAVPFDEQAAEDYGVIRSGLERQGTPIGPNDLFIAASAKAHDLVLVSNNVRELSRVAGLRLEDWEASP